MNDTFTLIALIVLIAILVIAYWAYNTCRLNKYLAVKHRKKCSSGSGSFTGMIP